MAINTYTSLQTYVVPSATSAVVLSSIPTNYTDLVIVISNLTASAANTLYCKVGNGTVDTTGSYSFTFLNGNGSSVTSSKGTGNSNGLLCGATTMGLPSTNPAQIVMNILNYSNTSIYKTAISRYSSSSEVEQNIALWRGTGAINTLQFQVFPSGNINAGTIFSVYGISNATIGAPKATGGSITQDALYTYHAFGANGTFTPAQNLTVDILVVAGGGGGQAGAPQGTGGGGGYVSIATGSSLSSGTGYTATIGGGGAGGVLSGSTAGVGTSSTFSTVTSTGGGVGGTTWYYPDRGGSSGNVVNGTTTNYTGGQTVTSDNSHLAGGGGAGAGANGNNSSGFTTTVGSSVGGDGFSHAIGNVGGAVIYYGGGGNGGTEGTGANGGWGAYGGYIPTYTSKGGGGWGGGQYPTSNPAAAPTTGGINTGGGGGGGTWGNTTPIVTGAGNGAAGGSGLVIVRYLS